MNIKLMTKEQQGIVARRDAVLERLRENEEFVHTDKYNELTTCAQRLVGNRIDRDLRMVEALNETITGF